MSAPNIFGQWLRQYRRERKLTRKSLAAALCCSIELVAKWETGERRPTKEMAELLAQALDIPDSRHAQFVQFARSAEEPNPYAEEMVLKIPHPATSFIGRVQAREDIQTALSDPNIRLYTLTGPGGVGKTRLAIQCALDCSWLFRNGIFFVDLSPVQDAALVPQAIAHVLEGQQQDGQIDIDHLVRTLHDKQILLILDSFEHLLDAHENIVVLLKRAPKLKILVTSRIVLRLNGENEYPVHPLVLPDQTQPIDVQNPCESVALFVARAQTVVPDFALTPANITTVTSLCGWLDGLPLAIELAAEHLKHLNIAEISTSFSQRLALDSPPETGYPSQPRLRTTIDKSYQLLPRAAQTLLVRLGVFVGGFTLSAAEAICSDQELDTPAVFDSLETLIDHSLIWRIETNEGESRFTILETLREYMLLCLNERDEYALIKNRHATYFLTWSETAEHALRGPEQQTWLKAMAADHDNLRTAYDWALNTQQPETALRIAVAMWRFWHFYGHWREAQERLEHAIVQYETQKNALLAKAINCACSFAQLQGNLKHAHALGERAATLATEIDDPWNIAVAHANLAIIAHTYPGNRTRTWELAQQSLNTFAQLGEHWCYARLQLRLGSIALEQGDITQAYKCGHACRQTAIKLGDQHISALALIVLGEAAYRTEDLEEAHKYAQESLQSCQKIGEQQGTAQASCLLGRISLHRGDIDQAEKYGWASLTQSRALGDIQGIASARVLLNTIAYQRNDLPRIVDCCAELLDICRQLDDRQSQAQALESFGHLALASGQNLLARQFWATADEQRTINNTPRSTIERHYHENLIKTTRISSNEGAGLASEVGNNITTLPHLLTYAQTLITTHRAPGRT